MKARLRLSKEVKKEVNRLYGKLEAEQFRRWLKLVGLALHSKRFGFGRDRIAELYKALTELSAQRDGDEIFWKHVDDVIIGELKIPFEREDYSSLDK